MHREPDARRAPAADQPAAGAAAPSAEQAADDAFLLCRDLAMLELFYCSGLRLIELSALDCAQLDLDAGRLRVAGRGGLCRDLPLARAARQALQAWLQQRATCAAASPALFVARNGQRVTLFPEARPTLAQLSRQFHLGVLTNGNADVARIGIADYFQFAFNAEALGISKPDPRIFHAALAAAGVPATAAVHIGDHPRDDIAGAQAAGLRAVWFNPQGAPWPGAGAPQAQIASLAELPALLARWHAGQP